MSSATWTIWVEMEIAIGGKGYLFRGQLAGVSLGHFKIYDDARFRLG